MNSIRIGTPVKSECAGSEDMETNKAEYTVSISSQNNVEVNITMPAFENIYDEQGNVCTPGGQLLEHATVDPTEEISEHEIQVRNEVVKLRSKKNPNRNCTTETSLSQTNEMKRHSTEITHLRQALEQKITDQGYRCRSDSGNPHEKRNILNRHGYSSLQSSPTKENKCGIFYSKRNGHKSISQISSPVNKQNNKRSHIHITDLLKLRFLDDQEEFIDQYPSVLYDEYTNAGNIDQQIPSPQPYLHNDCCEIRNRNNSLCINEVSPSIYTREKIIHHYDDPHIPPIPSSKHSHVEEANNITSRTANSPQKAGMYYIK